MTEPRVVRMAGLIVSQLPEDDGEALKVLTLARSIILDSKEAVVTELFEAGRQDVVGTGSLVTLGRSGLRGKANRE